MKTKHTAVVACLVFACACAIAQTVPPPPLTMLAPSWLVSLALGAFAGAIGQLVRSISGVVRLARERTVAIQTGQTPETFNVSTLVISLLIGATAGAVASLGLLTNAPASTQTILGLMAAGYAGADFIEGFAGKTFPAPTPAPPPPPLPPPPAPVPAPAPVQVPPPAPPGPAPAPAVPAGAADAVG